MKRLHWALTFVALTAAACQAADLPTAVIKLPVMGRTAAAITPLQRALDAAGIKATALPTLTPAGSVSPAPSAAILYQTEIADEADANAVREAVKQGMGLVYFVSSVTDRFEAANAFLKDCGLSVAEAPREGRSIRVAATAVAPGLSELPSARFGLTITGRGALVIGTQQGRAVVTGISYGKGRIVVMPVDALSGERSGEPPTAGTLALVTGCTAWAAHLEPTAVVTVAAEQPRGAKPTTSPGRKPTPPVAEASLQAFAPTTDFKGKTLVDVGAADDAWPVILQALAPLLQGLEAPPAALKTGGVNDALAPALRTEPALVVIGSSRVFSDAESIALSDYVQSGGRAFVLARATDATVMRIVALNNLLFGLDIVAALGRGGGPVELQQHPAVKGLTRAGNIPGGVRLMSERAESVAEAGGFPFIMAREARNGRLVVLDATPLAAGGKDAKAMTARDIYLDIVRACTAWLMAR